jgi:hypothetical protein
MNTQKLGERFLARVFVLEWLNGSTFLGTPGAPSSMWRDRNTVVWNHIESAKKVGHAESLETALWKGMLGYWLLEDGSIANAEPLLTDSARGLRRCGLKADDPLAREFDLLVATAGVRRVRAAAKLGKLTDAQKQELVGLEQTLSFEKDVFVGPLSGGPVHRLILRTMRDLYGKSMLNSRAEWDRVSKRLASLKN